MQEKNVESFACKKKEKKEKQKTIFFFMRREGGKKNCLFCCLHDFPLFFSFFSLFLTRSPGRFRVSVRSSSLCFFVSEEGRRKEEEEEGGGASSEREREWKRQVASRSPPLSPSALSPST